VRIDLNKERRSHIKQLGTEYRELLECVLKEGISKNHLRADIDTHFVAYSIIGICNSWGANLIRDDQLDLFETIEQCSDLISYGTLNRT